MSKATPTPVNNAQSAREVGRETGHGRSRARDGRDGCGRGRGAGRHNKTKYRNTKVFKGNTDDIKYNVFQCYGESPDKQQFNKTVDALAGYIDKNMDYLKDVASLYKKQKLSMIREPVDLTDEEKKSGTNNSTDFYSWWQLANCKTGGVELRFYKTNGVTRCSVPLRMHNKLWYIEQDIASTVYRAKIRTCSDAFVHAINGTTLHNLWHHRLCHAGKFVTDNIDKAVKGVPSLRKRNPFFSK